MDLSHASGQSLDGDYWSEARQPLACLAFLAPLLVIYEAGVLLVGGSDPESVRNGADYWMRLGLQEAGLVQPLVLPALVVGALLGWQIIGRFAWRVSVETVLGMFAESLLFAFALVVLGQLQDLLFQHVQASPVLSLAASSAAQIVAYVGAGVYEEVLFRLLLLPACFLLFKLGRLPDKWAAAASVLLTSLVFSAAHYIGPVADEPTLFSFTFRALAGVFFAALFVFRGFGITVGAHAAYDVIVGVLFGN